MNEVDWSDIIGSKVRNQEASVSQVSPLKGVWEDRKWYLFSHILDYGQLVLPLLSHTIISKWNE